MSSHATSAAGATLAAVQSKYARFCQWLQAFFTDYPDPGGVHAVNVFYAAFRAGFTTHAGQYLFRAAHAGSLL